jgi:hypothetical protein
MTLWAAPAFADIISSWCPEQAAVCSQQRNKRIIVYDPGGYFRQTTLATDIVPVTSRTQYAAQYSRHAGAKTNAPQYVRQYYFIPVGDY